MENSKNLMEKLDVLSRYIPDEQVFELVKVFGQLCYIEGAQDTVNKVAGEMKKVFEEKHDAQGK